MATTHKPKPYCTQPRQVGEGCETCSLSSYGRDCRNEPIPLRRQARGERKVEVHVRLPIDLAERLEGEAAEHGVTLAALIRSLLESCRPS